MLNYNKMLEKLEQKYNLGLTSAEHQSVTNKLKIAKANFQTDNEWLASIDSLTDGIRNNPLKVVAEEKNECPICKKACEEITLAGDRLAWYCGEHRTVQPRLK